MSPNQEPDNNDDMMLTTFRHETGENSNNNGIAQILDFEQKQKSFATPNNYSPKVETSLQLKTYTANKLMTDQRGITRRSALFQTFVDNMPSRNREFKTPHTRNVSVKLPSSNTEQFGNKGADYNDLAVHGLRKCETNRHKNIEEAKVAWKSFSNKSSLLQTLQINQSQNHLQQITLLNSPKAHTDQKGNTPEKISFIDQAEVISVDNQRIFL